MSSRLQLAQAEITAWAHTLEDRVDEKTRELKQAHQHMLQVEKMATIGKMAAVVAHEINNPLSGILTYSRVVKRWIQNNFSSAPRTEEMIGSLDLIASESKRCGELVKNLLSFSRVTPMNLEWCDLNQVIDRCVRLVQHKMDMATIQLNLALGEELPHVRCDPNQIEQVVLAMVINAIDAMPQGGNLWITTRQNSATTIELIIRDDGMGISDEHWPTFSSRSTPPRNPAARGSAWPSARTSSSATAAASPCTRSWGREPHSRFCCRWTAREPTLASDEDRAPVSRSNER